MSQDKQLLDCCNDQILNLKNGIQLVKEKNGVYVEIRESNSDPSNRNLKEYVNDDIKERFSSRKDFNLLNLTQTTISGNLPAYKAIYTFLNTENQKGFTSEGTNKVVLRITAFSYGNAYIIKYVSEKSKYDSYLPIAEKIIDSLRINAQEKSQVQKDASAKKSYQLIVYLDGASQQNAIGDNFEIVVYNAKNETILSAKPNIEFNDNHQKISPSDGYPIIDKTGQHPENIRVCAQQEYQLNSRIYLHDDCYPIKQNVQKTYWYTIFDYGRIDGFEGNAQDSIHALRNAPSIVPSATIKIAPGSSSPDNSKFFVPSTLTIPKGTTATWKNTDSTLHTITSGSAEGGEPGKDFDSSYLAGGKTFEWTFGNTGTFDYFCTLHPYMKGKIIVH